MIICYYAELGDEQEERLPELLTQLPLKVQNTLLKSKNKRAMCRSICGYILLVKMMQYFYPDEALDTAASDLMNKNTSQPNETEAARFQVLNLLHYSTYGRPYFQKGLDFNISHAGQLTACCGSKQSKVGIDVEALRQNIDTDLYREYFTEAEWRIIQDGPSCLKLFFHYWTRKEALLKAYGTGLDDNLGQLSTIESNLILEDQSYFIKKVDLNPLYICHIASSMEEDIKIMKVNLIA